MEILSIWLKTISLHYLLNNNWKTWTTLPRGKWIGRREGFKWTKALSYWIYKALGFLRSIVWTEVFTVQRLTSSNEPDNQPGVLWVKEQPGLMFRVAWKCDAASWSHFYIGPNKIICSLLVCWHFRAWVGREFILFYFLFYFFVEKRGRQGIVMDYFFIERIGKQGIYFIL